MNDVVASEAVQTQAVTLVAGRLYKGTVSEPFVKNDELAGAILSFEGTDETALLHIRQIVGDRLARLSDLSIGDPIMVRLLVQSEGSRRSVWATEKGVAEHLILERFASEPEAFKGINGIVHGTTQFGVFVELQDGPAQGQRGLVRLSSLSGTGASGKVKLGSFIKFKQGDKVTVDVVEGSYDEEGSKLLLRLDNMSPRVAAAA